MTRQTQIKKSLALGTPYVWLTSGAVAFCMILVIGVIGLITVRGAVHFWPKPIVMLNMTAEVSEERVMGEIAGTEVVSASLLKEQGIMVPDGLNSIKRLLIKTGNRKLNGVDFKWFNETDYIAGIEIPSNATVVEREEWGNFYGFINSIKENGQVIKPKTSLLDELDKRLTRRPYGMRCKSLAWGIQLSLQMLSHMLLRVAMGWVDNTRLVAKSAIHP